LSAIENKTGFRSLLYAVSVIEGGAVMGVELISAKMIGIYFGSSLYVWAAVLAVTLLGLATGYYAGGMVSSRRDSLSALVAVVTVSSILVALMPVWGDYVMKQSLGFSVQRASLQAAMVFLFPPLICFGMVSPLIVDLLSRHGKGAGQAAGTVYAVSTVGGIVVTLLVGFYLIPNLGLRLSAIGIGVVLAIIPLTLLAARRRFKVIIVLIFVLTGIVWAEGRSQALKESGRFMVRHRSDGLLGQVTVIETVRQGTNEHLRVLSINNISQNMIHLPSFRSKWRYVHRIALYASIKPGGSKALICGLGGGNVVNEFERLGFNVDAVEIDPRMDDIARNWFGMTESVRVVIDDCRHFLNTTDSAYDVVVLDMASGDTQPVNVYTFEAFQTIQDLLEPGGLVFLHYQGFLEGDRALAARSIGRTMTESGLSTRLLRTDTDPESVNEIMFLASNDSEVLESMIYESFERRDRFADPFDFPKGRELFLDLEFEGGYLLRDDWPVMERLHQPVVETLRGDGYRNQILELLADDVGFI
jgi:predicted membrane-bound spermidine synthase